jgi:diazepam-binding inhibitor (GABA receptor modulating acyl-CoA-binding protein)
MSIQAQFDKAVSIVKNLPKDGPVKPTQEDQLKVSPF